MQEGSFPDVDRLGKRLSLEIGCPVAWSGHDKNVFVCHHGLAFPLYRLQASDDWSWAKDEHSKVEGGE